MAGMLYAIAHVKVSKEKGKSRIIPTNWIDGGRPNKVHICVYIYPRRFLLITSYILSFKLERD